MAARRVHRGADNRGCVVSHPVPHDEGPYLPEDDQSDYSRVLEMRADYQQQAEEERRRYREAHPLWDKCREHPTRAALDPSRYDRQFCAECVDNHQRNYADAEPRYHADPISAWIHGAGDRPTSYFEKDGK